MSEWTEQRRHRPRSAVRSRRDLLMTTTDPRAILAKMQVIHDAALSSNANRALGKTLAALTDVMDLIDQAEDERRVAQEGSPTALIAYPVVDVGDLRAAITAALEVEG